MSADTNTCRRFTSAARDLPKHGEDVFFDCLDIGLNLFKWAGWCVLVEVTIEVDLVAHEPHFAVLWISPARVDPCVRHVRLHLAFREGFDRLPERNVLGVAELGVRLGITARIATDRGGLVALGEGREDRLLHRRGEPES